MKLNPESSKKQESSPPPWGRVGRGFSAPAAAAARPLATGNSQSPISNFQSPISNPPSGFTLTELLVAIALLLIIMVGVSTIFRTAGQTIGMGIAITDQNRALATAGQQLQQDIIGYSDTDPFIQGSGLWPVNENAPESAPPFLFIRNFAQNSFHDKAAADANTTSNFRLDSLGFFTRGAFKRQTGTILPPAPAVPQLVDDMPIFSKAYVWYGHLRLTGGAAMNPGETPLANNPNNFYANQWILGRRAILLTDVIADPSLKAGQILNSWGTAVSYYGRAYYAGEKGKEGASTPPSQWDPNDFAPLGQSGQATQVDNAFPLIPNQQVTESRFDIAGMNREQNWADYARLIQKYQTNWEAAGKIPANEWVDRSFAVRPLASPSEAIDLDWSKPTDDAVNQNNFSNAAALSVPILLRNCTNFKVEFAGDYLDQKPDSTLNSSGLFDVNNPFTWHLDGVIDFDVVNGRQQIRWYGLGNTVGFWRTTAMPFELASTASLYSCGWTKDMLCLPGTSVPQVYFSLAPKLIRITVEVTDPQGRVLEDMTRQFVFPVKYN